MSSIPLLLIGSAFDGPLEEPTLITDYSEAHELFGAYRYEAFTLTPSSTGITLMVTPWNNSIDVLYATNTGTHEPYYLHNLTLTGTTIAFNKVGEHKNIIVRFLREAGPTNLTRGLAEAQTADPETIYLMRVGGTKASTTLGTGSSYVSVESRYGGTTYNSVTFTATGGFLKVTQNGLYPTRWYSDWPLTAAELTKEINTDYAKGYGMLKATAVVGSGTIEGISSIHLTGGLNGTFESSAVTSLLTRIDLSRIRIVSLLGLDYEDISGSVNTALFEDMSIPTMFVQNMKSKESSASSAAYATSLLPKTPKLYFLSLVAASGWFTPYNGISYWNGAAAPYATLLAKEPITTSWKKIDVPDFTPVYSATSIDELVNAGFIFLNRTISKGVTVYRGTTSNSKWNSTCFIAYQTVCSRLYDALSNYIGVTNYSKTEVNSNVTNALQNIPSAKDVNYVIEFLPTSISILVKLQVIGEIQTMSFKIGVSTNAALPQSN